MKLVISGAGGFFGNHILDLLIEDEAYEIIALSSNVDQLTEYRQASNIQILKNEAFFSSPPLLDQHTLINLAYVRTGEFDLVKANCEFTFKLMESCRAQGISRIINISSQSVYDSQRTEKATETDLVKVNSLYDMGKYYLENWIADFGMKFNLDYLNLRIGSLVGSGFTQRITSRLVKLALEQSEITINMNGQIFSYTHVEDMAKAIVTAASSADSLLWNRTLNVGTSETYTLEDIANHIAQRLSVKGTEITVNKSIAEPNGMNSSLDSTQFCELTGWSCQKTLSDIIDEDIEFWSQRV